jgi:hypothetical protein
MVNAPFARLDWRARPRQRHCLFPSRLVGRLVTVRFPRVAPFASVGGRQTVTSSDAAPPLARRLGEIFENGAVQRRRLSRPRADLGEWRRGPRRHGPETVMVLGRRELARRQPAGDLGRLVRFQRRFLFKISALVASARIWVSGRAAPAARPEKVMVLGRRAPRVPAGWGDLGKPVLLRQRLLFKISGRTGSLPSTAPAPIATARGSG